MYLTYFHNFKEIGNHTEAKGMELLLRMQKETKNTTYQQGNKLKSLKVAQLKDEMDGDEDDGCGSVCDVVM